MPAPTLRDILPPSPEQLQQQLIGDDQFYRGLVTGAKGITSGSYANDALNAESAGDANAAQLRDTALLRQQEAQAYAPRVRSLRNIGGVKDAVDYGLSTVGQGLVSMAPTIAAAAATRAPVFGPAAARVTSYAGAAGAGYLQEKGETALGQYSDPTLAAAPVAERQRAATTKGVVNAALEGIVPAGLTSMVGKNGLGRIAAKDLVTEGSTEAAQTYVGHLADKTLDPTRQLDPWDIADAFAGGALTGGVVGGVHGAAYKLATTPKDFVTSTRAAIEEAGANAPSPQDFLKSVFKPNPSVDLDPVAAGDNHPDLVEAVTKAGDAAGEVLDSFTAKRGEMAASYADEILNDPATPAAVKQTVLDMNGDYESPQNQAALGAQYVGRKAGEVASSAADFIKGLAPKAAEAVKGFVSGLTTKEDPNIKRMNDMFADPETPEVLKEFMRKEMGADAPAHWSKDRVVKKNLQGGPLTEDETFALHKDIIDNLKPEAKRRTDVIADMPQLAAGIAGVINKYGAARTAPTDKNIQELQHLYSATSTLFDNPEAVFAKLASKVESAREGAKKATPFSDLLAGVTTAQQDVGKNQGKSYLQTRLVAPMNQAQVQQLARFVDEFGMTDQARALNKGDTQADKVLDGLAVAFGGKQEALQVLDYYSKANRMNAKQLMLRDQNDAKSDQTKMALSYAKELGIKGTNEEKLAALKDSSRIEGTKQLAQYDANTQLSADDIQDNPDDFNSGIREYEATPTRTYSFADAKTNRPFRRAERLATQDAASMRQGTVASDSAKVTTVPYSQYADETGKDHKAEVIRLMNDVKARQDKAYAGYAAELGVKGSPEAKLAAAKKYAAERRPSPDAKSTRLADIDRLQGELDMAREAYKEGGPKAALDLYEVNAAEQNEKDDLTATDEDLKAMATNKNDEDMVAFTKADGTKMVLSSKSMLLTQAAKEKRTGQAARGEGGTVREKRLMKEAIASVLAREDIAGVASEVVTPRNSKAIASFQGEHRFLSNFWPAKVTYKGDVFNTTEAAYQAAKSDSPLVRKTFTTMTAAEAKSAGRRVAMRPDFNGDRINVMRDLLEQKFADPALRAKLDETKGQELVEGNTWGDTFWGMTTKGGDNNLGKLLMEIRDGGKVSAITEQPGKGVKPPSHPKTPVKTNTRTELKDAPPTLKTFSRSKDTKAALKEQEPSIAELKLRVDERVKEYEDNADQDSRDEIRKGIERNIARLQSQYEKYDGEHYEPDTYAPKTLEKIPGALIPKSAPQRAAIRQRQAVYKEALAAINDVDFQEKVAQREKDGPDMATERTEKTGVRQYEEDVGTRIGDEKRKGEAARYAEKYGPALAAPDTPKTAAQLEREERVAKEQKKRDFEKLKSGVPIGEDRIVKNSFVGAKYFPESHKSAEKFFAGEPTQEEKDKVFTEQGWFKGPDGKLRREISPTAMAEAFRKSLVDGLTSPMLGTTRIERANFSLNLGDIMKAASSRMYEAYGKDLGDVHVQIGVYGDVGFLGSYDYKEKQLVIDPLAVAQSLAVRATGKKDVIAAKASGQITDKQIVDLVVSTFMHEFQHAIQRAEGFEGGGSLLGAIVSAYGTAAEKKEYRELIAREDDIDSFEASADRQHVLKTRINNRFYATLKPGEDPRKAAYDLYRRLIGEAEAHNVQDRLDLTPEERRTVKPVLARKEEFAKIWFINSFLNDVAASIVKSSKQDAREAGPANATPKDQQEALDEIERIRGKDVTVAFAKFAQIQGSGEFSMNKDKTKRLIRLAVDGANMKSTAWHESLHDFIGMLGTTPEERKLKRDMLDATNTPYINAKLRELLQGHPEAIKQLSDPEERLAYVYQFWAEGALKLTPKADSLLAKLATFIRQLMGIVSQDGKLDAQLQALHSGALTEPSTVARVLDDLDAKTVGDKLEALAGPLGEGLSKVFTSATDRLRKPGIEALDKIAVLFHKDPGHESGKGGMLQRRAQKEGQLSNAFQKLVEGTTAAERKQALDNLQAMQTPSGPLELGLTKLLDEMYTYMTEAGVATFNKDTKKWDPVRRVANYFPRAWDGATISKDVPAFKALLAANGVSVQQQGAIVDLLTKSGESQFDLAENDKSLGFVPLAVHVNDRMLTFINKNNAAAFAKYQNKDLTDIMTTYIRQASHRAEYARSFGNNGEVIESLLEQARSQGMTNAEEASILPTIRGLEGTLGHDMNPQMKKIMSGVITMENVLLMPMAIFSQMVDPIGIAMRTNSVKDAGAAYLQSLKDLKKFVSRDKSFDYDRELTKMLGIISTDSMLETMGQTQGSMYMTSTVRNINRQFFRYNGMEGWNNSMRVAATVAGERYLLANVGNERAMTELDLDPKYVLALPQGTKWGEAGRMAITKEQFESLGMSKDEAQVAAEKIQEAMFRFVDGAVVRPNAAHRATWMSDPRFQLLSHLKQFTFSFQSAVLNRARNEYIHGNTTPLLLLSMTVPITLAADIAKWTMTGTIPANWTALDYMTHAVARSGILGKYEYTARAVEDAARGNVPGLSFAGPTVEHANILAQWIAGAPGVSSDRLIDRSVPLARYA